MDDSVLLARQPIFDSKNDLYAHEFLYRRENLLNINDISDMSTRELLVNICTSILEKDINMGLPMFINVDAEFLMAEDFFPIAPKNIVFEILETIPPTPIVLQRINKLKSVGFEFALDDYLLEKSKVPFFKFLKIIKVDVLGLDFNRLEKAIPTLKNIGCLLLAEKVENQEVYDKCLALGFDLFQGFYLEKPSIIKGKKVEANKQSVLHLLSELSRSDIEVDEVAELISRDTGLALKIFALVNSPIYQLVRDVSSVKDAVVILGLDVVKQWAITLVLVSNSSRPIELFRIILIRAKTLALYANHAAKNGKKVTSSTCFLVGLLSGVEAIFEREMKEVLKFIKLNPEIKIALLQKDNDLGEMLKISIGIERFSNSVFEQLTNQEVCSYNRCYRDALKWADEVMKYL
ncbi:EAL and HDOD domain-containing protein [Paraglaciecola sp. L3A3]|uniref:EAL and HDOD domain-containing protein n=1 Tax=Paraglaciecola sp. L3A3 TaxID=2686358 RepID=UPI00131B1D89|nr:HDOD domain-containing protein [Paraglaciecola sp. L3A3]